MIIFNLTATTLHIHGQAIAPNGGSKNFANLTETQRDTHLQESGVISIGALPDGWKPMTTGVKAVTSPNPRGVKGISTSGRKVTTTATGKTVTVKDTPIFTSRKVPKSAPVKR